MINRFAVSIGDAGQEYGFLVFTNSVECEELNAADAVGNQTVH